MNFVKEKIRDFYLRDSQIENIFINEYLPAAPGDYVKVFIYGAMYAEFGLDMTNELMAKQLGISVRKVMDAWNYWEQMGAIRKLYFDENGRVDFSVEFINLKEQMYRYRYEYIKQDKDYSDLVTDHSKILDGLRRKDVNYVRSVMHEHLQNQVDSVKKVIQEQNEDS